MHSEWFFTAEHSFRHDQQRKTIQLVRRSGGGLFRVPHDYDTSLGRLDQIQRRSPRRSEESGPGTRSQCFFEDVSEIATWAAVLEAAS